MIKILNSFLSLPLLYDAHGMKEALSGIPAQIGGNYRGGGVHFKVLPDEIQVFDRFRFVRGNVDLSSPLIPIHFLVEERGLESLLFRSLYRKAISPPAPSMECYAIQIAKFLGLSPLYVPEKNEETVRFLSSSFGGETLSKKMEERRDDLGRFYVAVHESRKRNTTLFECLEKLKELEILVKEHIKLNEQIGHAERALLQAEGHSRFTFVSMEKERLLRKRKETPGFEDLSHLDLEELLKTLKEVRVPEITLAPKRASVQIPSSPVALTYPSGMPLEREDGTLFGENGELLAKRDGNSWEFFG